METQQSQKVDFSQAGHESDISKRVTRSTSSDSNQGQGPHTILDTSEAAMDALGSRMTRSVIKNMKVSAPVDESSVASSSSTNSHFSVPPFVKYSASTSLSIPITIGSLSALAKTKKTSNVQRHRKRSRSNQLAYNVDEEK